MKDSVSLNAKRLTLMFVSAMLLQTVSFANKHIEKLSEYAASFLNTKIQTSHKLLKKNITASDMSVTLEQGQVIMFEEVNGRFVMLTRNCDTPLVIGYSLEEHHHTGEIPPALLEQIDAINNAIIASKIITSSEVPSYLPDHVDPLLTTTWNQWNPYNLKCPEMEDKNGNITTCPTGCVPTAMAQLMNYYKYPQCGTGANKYTLRDNTIMEMDFSAVEFDWEHMLNHYDNAENGDNNYSQTEANAVASLMLACGVSISTDYKADASGAFASTVNDALKNNFGYKQARYYEGKNRTYRMGKIYFNLAKSKPVMCWGRRMMTDHAYILDGYDTEGRVHANWGWGGNYDGFYAFDALLYSALTEKVVCDVEPPYYEHHVDFIMELEVEKAGSLSSTFSDLEACTIEGLRITGNINDSDFMLIRRMDNLYYLDLSAAHIVADPDRSSTKDNEIPEYAFRECQNLETVILPESATSIGWGAFYSCKQLNSVTIGQNVSNIARNAFWDCESLAKVNIPEGITQINNVTFAGCKSLKSIKLPNNLTWIGDLAFSGCSNLETIAFPNTLTHIGEAAFSGCKSLSMPLEIGKDVDMREKAFYGCENIPSVYLQGLYAGDDVFSHCTNLSHVEIGANMFMSNAYNLFSYCPNLTSIIVSGANPMYDSRGDCNAIIEKGTNKLITGCKETIIPPSVVEIGGYAFAGCSGLTSMELPPSVKELSDWCSFLDCTSLKTITLSENLWRISSFSFKGCSSLESIHIPKSVIEIGSNLFDYCTNLTSITVDEENPNFDSRDHCNAIIETNANRLVYGCSRSVIPKTITEIGIAAFRYCTRLETITIPNNITKIQKSAFYNCPNLMSVISEIEEPFDIDYSVFAISMQSGNNSNPDIFSSATLYVPIGTREKYENTIYWNAFTNIIEGDGASYISPVEDKATPPHAYYSIDGIQLDALRKGLNIIRYADGSIRKVIVR